MKNRIQIYILFTNNQAGIPNSLKEEVKRGQFFQICLFPLWFLMQWIAKSSVSVIQFVLGHRRLDFPHIYFETNIQFILFL